MAGQNNPAQDQIAPNPDGSLQQPVQAATSPVQNVQPLPPTSADTSLGFLGNVGAITSVLGALGNDPGVVQAGGLLSQLRANQIKQEQDAVALQLKQFQDQRDVKAIRSGDLDQAATPDVALDILKANNQKERNRIADKRQAEAAERARLGLQFEQSRLTGILPPHLQPAQALAAPGTPAAAAPTTTNPLLQPVGTPSSPETEQASVIDIANELAGGNFALLTASNKLGVMKEARAEFKRRQQAAELVQKEALSVENQRDKTKVALTAIRDSIGHIDDPDNRIFGVSTTTGLVGQIMRGVGGSAALDLREKLKPIQAILAGKTLSDLKQQSRTGATGFGQLSEKELELLISMYGSLEQAQTDEQLKNALFAIQALFRKNEERLRAKQGKETKTEKEKVDPNSDEAARQWLKDNPNHEDAPAVRAALGE